MALNTTKGKRDTTTDQKNLPRVLITEKICFVFHSMDELAHFSDINIDKATTMDAQTIGVLERVHATKGIALNFTSGEHKINWHNFLLLSFLKYTTKNYSCNDCQICRVIHGRVPLVTSDDKHLMIFNPIKALTADSVKELLRRTKLLKSFYREKRQRVLY